MRSTPFTQRLLAATAIGIISTSAAAATNGITSTDSTPISNPSGTTVTGDRKGVYSTGSALNLDNAGTIRGNGNAGSVNDSDGGVIFDGGPGTISNSGTISGARFGISTIYFNNAGTFEGRAIGSTVDNSGSIIGDSDDAIRLIGGGTVTNSGLISGRVGVGADGISMFAYNGQNTAGMTSIGSVTNLAGGLIEGNRWGVVLFGGGSVDNAGTISHGVNIGGSPLLGAGQAGSIVNSGAITGSISLNALDSALLNNSGVIDVSNIVSTGSGTLINSGTINYFASYHTVGTATVNNSGSIGEALMFRKTTTANVTNSGSITATNTSDVVGTTQDAVYSEAALTLTNADTGSINGFVSGIRSNGASLTLDNAGTIRGNGDQDLRANSAGGVVLQGGPGFITNSGLISGQQFGITTIYVTSDPPLGLAIGSTIDNSGSIIGDNNDGVRLIGGGSVTNSGYIAGRVGAVADGISMFSFDGQDLTSFDVIGSVTNLAGGVIEGNRFGVIMSNGGIVDNAGTISGIGGSILLQAQEDGADLPRNGTVTNSGTLNGTVQFNNLASAGVDNSGSITSLTGNGVYTTAPSGSLSVNNQALGSITGAMSGIRSDGSSLTLNNAGSIQGNGTSNTPVMSNGAVLVTGGPASITNSGSILGANYGITTGYYTDPVTSATSGRAIGSTVDNSGSIIGNNNDGVRLIGGGSVTNSGTIAGRDNGDVFNYNNSFLRADGVSMFGYEDQDTTGMAGIGSVINLAGGQILGNRFGVIFSGGGSVANDGLILGYRGGGILIQSQFDGQTGKTGSVTNSEGAQIWGGITFYGLDSASVDNAGAIDGVNATQLVAGVRSYSPLTLNNSATGVIEGSSDGVRSDGPSLTLNNAGTIFGLGTDRTETAANGGVILSGGPASITNSGSISGAMFGIATLYFTNPDNSISGLAIDTTINNSGSIVGEGEDGIRLHGGGTVTNSGYIAGKVRFSADGVSILAFDGQDLSGLGSAGIGTVNNLAGGVIEGHREGIIISDGGTINNAGTINGGTRGAIVLEARDAGRIGTLTNSGAINGVVDFIQLDSASLANSGAILAPAGAAVHGWSFDNYMGPLAVTNDVTGTIVGGTSGIFSEGALLSLTNAGSIRGNGISVTSRVADAGILITGGPASITNSGSISGAGFGITTGTFSDFFTNAASSRAIGSTVTNTGSIIGDSNDGVRLIGGGTVTNSGLISGRVGSVADGISMFAFEDQATTAQIGTVNNLAGGIIEGFRFGIIQSGGGTINNAGTINGGTNGAILIQTGFTNNKTGAITNSGSVNGNIAFNELVSASVANSGTINGEMEFNSVGSASLTNSGSISQSIKQWTVYSNSNLSVVNSGTIANPSTVPGNSTLGGIGVWADGNLILNNTGTISTLTPAVLGFGPASAIANSGTIASVQSSGVQLTGTLANSGHISGGYAGALLIGGSITNSAGATIDGGTYGIHFFGGSESLNNAGTITVTNTDSAVAFESVGAGAFPSVTNSGTINGSVQLGNNQSATLTNSGSIIARGSSVAISSQSPTTIINSGSISTTGSTAISLLGNNKADTVTLLTGSSISGAVDGGSGSDTLRLSGTVATPTTSQTVGRFLNFETLNVLGGYWTAPGNTGSFTSTTISGGALAVNGTLSSPVTVNAGAMLAGTGTITGAVTMNSGGLLSPGGSSLGTLSITGNVAFNAGSTLSVQTNPSGASDKLAVTGAVTISRGSTLQVLAGIFPNYPATSSYVVVNASGGISGKFDTVTTDYAYFKATVNTQQKGTITVQIAPNGKPLPTAASATTFGTASAVESLGATSALYQSVLYQSLTGARDAFSAFSGSSYARLDALMAGDVGRVRLASDGSDTQAADIEWGGVNSLAARGFHSGLLRRRGSVSLFMVGGRYTTRLSSDSIAGDVDSRFVASAAAFRSGGFRALAGVTGAWHDVSVARTIAFPGFAERTLSRYRATTQRLDLEGSYDLVQGPLTVAPYGGYAHLRIASPAFGETGGLSALTFNRETQAMDQLRLGIRIGARLRIAGLTLAPHVDADVERQWGTAGPARTAHFAIGGSTFDSGAYGFNGRAANIDGGVDIAVGRAILSAKYRARLGDQWSDRTARLSATLPF